MVGWLDVQTLIWLFPIAFMFHDLEEIIMVEKWLKNNAEVIHQKLPKRLANRIMKQFSMSTVQFAVAVVVVFLFVSISTIMASQYVNQGPISSIYFFIVCVMGYFLHAFTHIGQAIYFGTVTPGAITSFVIILPYSFLLFSALFSNGIITWHTIWVSLPFLLLFLPMVLFAHWIGKKATR